MKAIWEREKRNKIPFHWDKIYIRLSSLPWYKVFSCIGLCHHTEQRAPPTLSFLVKGQQRVVEVSHLLLGYTFLKLFLRSLIFSRIHLLLLLHHHLTTRSFFRFLQKKWGKRLYLDGGKGVWMIFSLFFYSVGMIVCVGDGIPSSPALTPRVSSNSSGVFREKKRRETKEEQNVGT